MERYITDKQGNRTVVILSIEEHEALVAAAEEAADERIYDESVAEIARGGETRTLDQIQETRED